MQSTAQLRRSRRPGRCAMLRSSEKAVAEAVLGRRPGVERVEANPVARPPTLVSDPARASWPTSAATSRSAACTAPASRFPTTSAVR